MARQILPIVGAAVGFVVTGGNPMGAQAGFAIGSIVGNAIDPIEMQGRKLGDAPTQVAAEGGARAIVFGKGCIRATCVIERGGRRVIKERQSQGKGSGPTTVNERALWTFAIGLGEAIVGGKVLRIWEAEKLVYDVTPDSTIPGDSAKFAGKFRFYDGSDDQLPDPALEALYGTGNAPYYRGTAYLVFPQYDLTDFGETVPPYRAEVATLAESTGYWDAEHTGAGGVLENATRTFVTDITGTQRPLTRSYVGATLADKFYCEVVLDVFPIVGGGDPTFSVGIVNQDHAYNNMPYVGRGHGSGAAKGIGITGRSTRQNVTVAGCGGPGSGEIFGPAFTGSGQVIRVAFDGPAGKLYFSDTADWEMWRTNGVYGPCEAVTADPTLGTNPLYEIFNWAIGTAFYVAVAGRDGDGGTHLRATLRQNESEFTFEIPIGFLALGNLGATHGFPVPLSSIISTLHLRCGHGVVDFDVSDLDEMVSGVVIEQTVTAAEAILSILGTHFADPSDYDGSIHYIRRGKPVVRAIGADDLVDEPEESQRNNAIEYPRKVHLLGQRADLAYSAAKSTSARYSKDARVVGEASVASPETFDEGETPLKAAIKLHKVLWTKAEGETTIHVTDEHLDLVPTDCVDFSYAGNTSRYMIDQISDEPGVRKLKMTRDRQSAYEANPTDIPTPPPPTPPQPSTPTDTILAIIDGPALLDNADTLHYLAAATGDGDPWVGFTLQQSLDGGATFVSIDTGSLNAIMGKLQAEVSAASAYYTDATNKVTVRLYTDDELESRTQQAFLSNGGAFFLSWQDSGDTRWELMQFRDAAKVGDDWELSHLLRGRKNTETAGHPVGATFVYLDTAVLREAAQSAWIGAELTHRAVSNGLSPETASVVQTQYAGYSQREWPVAELMLDRAGDDITATVVPRHRFGTSMVPVRSINWIGYRWTATDGTNTITRDGTSASEIFDATGWASPVSVTVSQINRITGSGDAVTEDIA